MTSRLSATLGFLAVLGSIQADFEYKDFASRQSLKLIGSAEVVGTILRLTPSEPRLTGGLYVQERQNLADGFECEFTFRVSGTGGVKDPRGQTGGEGLALVFHNDPRGTSALHSYPLAYAKIKPSLVVELDMWHNGKPLDQTYPIAYTADPDGNHISALLDGEYFDSIGSIGSTGKNGVAALGTDLSDGRAHNVRVRYEAKTLTIFLDEGTVPILKVMSLDLPAKTGGASAFVGLVGGTGDAYQTQDILRWSFRSLGKG